MKNNNLLKLILLFLILIILTLFLSPLLENFLVSVSLEEGVSFLYSSQLDSGEFKSEICKGLDLKSCLEDSSLFVTSTIIYSLKDIPDPRIEEINSKGLDFLLIHQQKGGIWKYSTFKNLSPDVDDISLISFVLKDNNLSFQENRPLIINNTNKEGIFYTWLDNSPDNDIECVVNANVLLYLGEIPEVCDYLNRQILNKSECFTYYQDEFALYYSVSRDFIQNISCFNNSKDFIVKEILNTQRADGSFGDSLRTALAVSTLINFNFSGNQLEKAVFYLMKNQKKNGSWEKIIFYDDGGKSKVKGRPSPVYFVSESLTTSFCVEALNKFLNN